LRPLTGAASVFPPCHRVSFFVAAGKPFLFLHGPAASLYPLLRRDSPRGDPFPPQPAEHTRLLKACARPGFPATGEPVFFNPAKRFPQRVDFMPPWFRRPVRVFWGTGNFSSPLRTGPGPVPSNKTCLELRAFLFFFFFFLTSLFLQPPSRSWLCDGTAPRAILLNRSRESSSERNTPPSPPPRPPRVPPVHRGHSHPPPPQSDFLSTSPFFFEHSVTPADPGHLRQHLPIPGTLGFLLFDLRFPFTRNVFSGVHW